MPNDDSIAAYATKRLNDASNYAASLHLYAVRMNCVRIVQCDVRVANLC